MEKAFKYIIVLIIILAIIKSPTLQKDLTTIVNGIVKGVFG